MKQKKQRNFLQRNWWITILLTLSAAGFIFGYWGFGKLEYSGSGSLYETLRMFVLSVSTKDISHRELGTPWQLECARWLIFAAFLWATFRLFFEIIAPQFVNNLPILAYRRHIIVCGLNQFTISLIEKFGDEKIIVLAEEANQFDEALKSNKNVKLLIGDFADESLLKRSKLDKASALYAIVDNDKVNVKIAQSVFSYLEKRKRENNKLKCFVLIEDRELKTMLEESLLFKESAGTFDAALFNINEMGIKYGIAMNIDKILPAKMTTPPEILFVGLTEKTGTALFNLTHCLTMQREAFRFTIAENDAEKIRLFEKQCRKLHLRDFAGIEISGDDLEKVCSGNTFGSIFICIENPTDAIKQAVEIHYLLGKNAPNILLFYNKTDTFNRVMEAELEKKKIYPINLFEEITNYVFDLEGEESRKIEEKAKEAHYFWNLIYNMNKEWESMPAHFKQSNRNQILDNFLRTYIAFGRKFDEIKEHPVSFPDGERDRETLSIMEHRRWMLEKYENGWILGTRDNSIKRHNCLIPWEELSDIEQAKDADAIDLMIRLLTFNRNRI